MARGRMINQSISEDKRLNDLSIEAQLVYLMTIPFLDRDGLIIGEPMILWGKVCPRRQELISKMESIIVEWIDQKLVVDYECDDGTVLFFTGFAKNNPLTHYKREAASKYPPPPGYIRTESGLEKSNDSVNPDELRMNSGLTPDEVPLNRIEKNRNRKECNVGDDDGWRLVVDTYQQEIGVITPSVSELMQARCDELGATLVVDAIRESSRNNVRKWSYVDGILIRWKANGRAAPKPESKPKRKGWITDPVTQVKRQVAL